MNVEYRIMLKQSENQAKKLTEMEVSPSFFKELDIFDNYFDQLKQIIESKQIKTSEFELKELIKFINLFTEKLKKHKSTVENTAKNAGRIKVVGSYGLSSVYDEAIKFDKRS